MSGLTKEVENKIKDAFKEIKEVDRVILYGSRAKGNYKVGSDIDITLIGENLNLQTIYRVMDKLDDLYLPYKFDISIFDYIDNEDLIEHIKRVGKIFYQKEKN
jgi:predicted nucleotidyltransferase